MSTLSNIIQASANIPTIIPNATNATNATTNSRRLLMYGGHDASGAVMDEPYVDTAAHMQRTFAAHPHVANVILEGRNRLMQMAYARESRERRHAHAAASRRLLDVAVVDTVGCSRYKWETAAYGAITNVNAQVKYNMTRSVMELMCKVGTGLFRSGGDLVAKQNPRAIANPRLKVTVKRHSSLCNEKLETPATTGDATKTDIVFPSTMDSCKDKKNQDTMVVQYANNPYDFKYTAGETISDNVTAIEVVGQVNRPPLSHLSQPTL
jgi:hypothetical protein